MNQNKFVIAVFAILLLGMPGVSHAAVSTHTVWEATKLLTINVNNNPGTELGTLKKKFAIGPGEWKVTHEENSVVKYVSTWKLPQLPDCYRNYSICLTGTQLARDYLWAAAFENDQAHTSWTFELVNPDAAELFVQNHSYAWGQGVLGGMNNSNTNNISTTGIYGWAHGKYENSDGGTIMKSGAMIPLHWRVEGRFQ